jgi:hypothetical protein
MCEVAASFCQRDDCVLLMPSYSTEESTQHQEVHQVEGFPNSCHEQLKEGTISLEDATIAVTPKGLD